MVADVRGIFRSRYKCQVPSRYDRFVDSLPARAAFAVAAAGLALPASTVATKAHAVELIQRHKAKGRDIPQLRASEEPEHLPEPRARITRLGGAVVLCMRAHR